MKEIKNKLYKVKGLMMVDDRIFADVPMTVNVTNDNLGCTVSIGSPGANIQFTVPFDKVLKDLEAK